MVVDASERQGMPFSEVAQTLKISWKDANAYSGDDLAQADPFASE